jgi:hypothetical protein
MRRRSDRGYQEPFDSIHDIPLRRISFRDQFGIDLVASADDLAYSLTDTPVECAAIESDYPLVVYGFARPNPKGDGSADIVALEFMCVTKQGVPVASGFEYEVAGELVNRGRRFEKPIRYAGERNHPEGHPDFWLTEAHKPVRMEVFGMNHPDYMKRVEAKIAKHGKSVCTAISGHGSRWTAS